MQNTKNNCARQRKRHSRLNSIDANSYSNHSARVFGRQGMIFPKWVGGTCIGVLGPMSSKGLSLEAMYAARIGYVYPRTSLVFYHVTRECCSAEATLPINNK
jgi:hypothetical protein